VYALAGLAPLIAGHQRVNTPLAQEKFMSVKSILAAFIFAAAFGAVSTAPAQAPAAATQSRLNPNTATAAELASVPHFTPALVAATQSKKPFKTVGDFNILLKASLTSQQLAEVYPIIFVPINLNTASKEDIALIPGMTPRMVHEFEEYRPYSNIDQFNKEIGKYVSAAEGARLRSYVTLN
jgi:DNA uptake protein ComE-like DNA-binding protein